MRVLFVSCDPLEGAVTRYRCTHLAEALKAAGHTADVTTIYDPVIRLEHDIVVLHRICANKEGQALADAVRKSGATLIYGADDLVFEEGPHRTMLQQADVVLVSTKALADFAREAGSKDVVVIRNWAVEKELESEPLTAGNDIDVVPMLYGAGTRTHDADLALIAPALMTVMSGGIGDEQLVLAGRVGCPVELLDLRTVRFPWSEWSYYIALVQGCEVMLAPLEPTKFNSGKSELKWLEAAICKKPTVASRHGGFAEVVTDGKNGYLAEGVKEWEEKLLALVGSERERRRMGRAAYTAAKKQAVEQSKKTVVTFKTWMPQGAVTSRRVTNYLGWLKGLIKRQIRRVR